MSNEHESTFIEDDEELREACRQSTPPQESGAQTADTSTPTITAIDPGPAAGAEIVRADSIVTQERLSGLLKCRPEVLAAITASMREKGFDHATPLVVWRDSGRLVLVDGHTRHMAAQAAGIVDVPAVMKAFADEDDAMLYAIHAQRNRRNLTQAELAKLVMMVDRLLERGGDRRSADAKSKTSRDVFDSSAKRTAEVVGVSASTVDRIRLVEKDPDAKAKVDSGQTTINKAAKEVRARRKAKAAAPTIGSQAEDNEPAFIAPAATTAPPASPSSKTSDEVVPATTADAYRVAISLIERAIKTLTAFKIGGSTSLNSSLFMLKKNLGELEANGGVPPKSNFNLG